MTKTHIQLELERAPLEVLLRYVEGKLSAPEQKTIETLVQDSPVYTDALEGLKHMENPALARSMTNDLRFRTRSLLRRKGRPRVATRNFNQYLTAVVAAGVVLFAAASVIYFYSRNDVPAVNIASADGEPNQAVTSAESEEDKKRLRPFRRTTPIEYDGPSITEDIIADASPERLEEDNLSLMDVAIEEVRVKRSTTTDTKSETAAPVPGAATPTRETVYVALPNEPTLSNERMDEYDSATDPKAEEIAETTVGESDDFAQAEIDSRATTSEVVEEGTVMLDEVVVTKQAGKEKRRNEKDVVNPEKAYLERQKRKAELMNQGEVLFNTSRYGEAEKVFLELYTLDQLDPKTQYYLGSTYFFLGRPAESTIYLEQVIRVSSDFLEEGQWRLVDAYLAVSKKKEAERLLKKISKQNGKYKDRAQAKLKEIR